MFTSVELERERRRWWRRFRSRDSDRSDRLLFGLFLGRGLRERERGGRSRGRILELIRGPRLWVDTRGGRTRERVGADTGESTASFSTTETAVVMKFTPGSIHVPG